MENKKSVAKKMKALKTKEPSDKLVKTIEEVTRKEPPLKFKSFALLFFQDSIQNINQEINHLKGMRKHHMEVLRKLLPMSDENVVKHFSDIPEMMKAYEDLLKES